MPKNSRSTGAGLGRSHVVMPAEIATTEYDHWLEFACALRPRRVPGSQGPRPRGEVQTQ